MHEIGIMESALALAQRQAQAAGAVRVHEIRMRVGRMTGVVPEALQHAFAALRPGTFAAEAVLAVEYVAGICWCHGCSREFEADGMLGTCPTCGETSVEVRAGTELELVSLEVD